MIGDRPSGPTALEHLAFLMAFLVCSMVTITSESVDFFLMSRMSLRKALVGLVVEGGVYWEFNLLAILLGLL